jgi:hypothetical protein
MKDKICSDGICHESPGCIHHRRASLRNNGREKWRVISVWAILSRHGSEGGHAWWVQLGAVGVLIIRHAYNGPRGQIELTSLDVDVGI